MDEYIAYQNHAIAAFKWLIMLQMSEPYEMGAEYWKWRAYVIAHDRSGALEAQDLQDRIDARAN